MLSTRTSRWVAATAVLSVVLVAATWLLLIGPRRGDAARLREERVSAQASNDNLRLQIAQLKAQFAQLSTKQAELASVQQELPPTAEIPALVRNLNAIAGTAGVRLDSLTPGAATFVNQAAAPAAGAGAQPTAPKPGLVSIPVAVVVTGDYFQAALFLRKLQTQLHRGFLINSLAVKPGDAGSGTTSGTVSMTLNGEIFVLPTGATGAAGGTTAGGTGAAGTTGQGAAAATGTVN
jgi:Tfp pilus assembly protein PilO